MVVVAARHQVQTGGPVDAVEMGDAGNLPRMGGLFVVEGIGGEIAVWGVRQGVRQTTENDPE
jgi:hypothetical protein